MTTFQPGPGPSKGECQCTVQYATGNGAGSCGLYGTLGRPYADGTRHIRGCPCRRCLGKRSKRKGQRKQAKATTLIGIPRSSIHPGHEEFLGGTVRIEVKAGKTHAGPVMTKFLLSERQSEAARAFGDNRPFVALFMPDGTADGLVVFRLSKLRSVLDALYEQVSESPPR